MKIRLLIFSVSLIISHQILAERTYAKIKPPCQCYCSVKCGPRAMEADDAPFYDDEHDQCFCKERDYQLYVKNGCSTQKNKKFITCCDLSKKKAKKYKKTKIVRE